jgi:hypothetical protein
VTKLEPALAPFVHDAMTAAVAAEHDILTREWAGEPRPTPETAEPRWPAA